MNTMRILLLPGLFLLGADSPGLHRAALRGPIPLCRAGEYLTARQGQLRCISRLGQLLSAPPCPSGYLSNTDSALPLTCIPRQPGDVAALSALEQRYYKFAAQRDATLANRYHLMAFAGITKKTTRGRIERAGTAPGLLSAHALCNDEFPDAHMCNGYELYRAVVNQELSSDKNMLGAWIYHPTWKTPLPGAPPDLAGLGDNCAGYSYDRDDQGYSGTWSYGGFTATGRWGLKFIRGNSAKCSNERPIACCY